jgi:hypothetical protein
MSEQDCGCSYLKGIMCERHQAELLGAAPSPAAASGVPLSDARQALPFRHEGTVTMRDRWKDVLAVVTGALFFLLWMLLAALTI